MTDIMSMELTKLPWQEAAPDKQHPPQSLPPPRTAPKKLKESCDTCALSKVKCSKDQPICVRCAIRQLPCNYSPSRRMGKRRASPPVRVDTITPDSTPSPHEARSNESPGIRRALSSDAVLPLALNIHESEMQVDSDVLAGPLSMFSPELDSTLYGPPSTGPHDPACLVPSDICMMDQSSDTASIPSSFDDVSSLMTMLNQPPPSVSPPTFHDPLPLLPHIKTCAEEPQDHMRLALSLLHSLHMPPSSPPTPSGPLSSAGCAPTIDYVLANNKSIMATLSAILTCPCSLDSQLALVLTLIASKALAWYGAAARHDSSNSGAAERVLQLPMTVGKYQLDGDNEGTMRAQLVLSELHNVGRIVEQFGKRFCDDVENAEEDKRPSSTMCAELKRFLLERLRATTKDTVNLMRNE